MVQSASSAGGAADLADLAAGLAAYLAERLARRARQHPTARAGRLATDALDLAVRAHALAADVWDALAEGRVVA